MKNYKTMVSNNRALMSPKLLAACATALVLTACGGSSNSTDGGTSPPPPPPPQAISADIGLMPSVLDESHRFDKPASRVVITAVDSASLGDALDYTVNVTNLTNNQPLSPVLVVAHGDMFQAFTDGVSASDALELLAEGGDSSMLVTEAMASADYLDHISTDGPIAPKSSQTLMFTVLNSDNDTLRISLLSMLVNTNDAFTGLNSVDISMLMAGDRKVFNGNVWDSGTEANSEAAGTMPGPADGGEGFNVTRDDPIDRVRIHSGVVTNALASGIVAL